MEVRFDCVFEGKRLFQVIHFDGETSLFAGTFSQCKRFIEVHEEKAGRARGSPVRVESQAETVED